MRTPRYLLAGLAALAVAACDGDPTGSLPDVFDCSRVSNYTLGSTVNGSLTTSDCVLPVDDSYVDYYRVEVSSGRTVTITMRSNDIDSYLILFDEDGDVVDFDDDGDPNTQFGSRLDVTLNAGRYYLAANSAFVDETGSYTLDSF